MAGLFVYAGEFIETEDGKRESRDQHEKGHVCGCGCGTALWWFCWWSFRVDVLISLMVSSEFLGR